MRSKILTEHQSSIKRHGIQFVRAYKRLNDARILNGFLIQKPSPKPRAEGSSPSAPVREKKS